MAIYLQGGTKRTYTNYNNSYTVNNLLAGTTYDVKVGCYRDTGTAIPETTGWSETIYCSTTATPPPDTQAPTVSITNPQNGATVKKNSTVLITAKASDNVGVSKVEFSVDGSLKCLVLSPDSAAQYNCSWSVPKQPRVKYTISAKAFDAANNSSSSSVTVTSK